MPSGTSKRCADWDPLPPPTKAARRTVSDTSVSSRKHVHKPWKPIVKHRNHPDCGVGRNFHSVPYPLTLLTYGSWHTLHNRPDPNISHQFRCPQCRKDRGTPSPHAHKLFLVAERLSWEDSTISTLERNQNEELNWEVNYQLGILEPAMEDPDQFPGGKNSRANKWYPYDNEFEVVAAMKLVEKATSLTEGSWRAWVDMVDYLPSEPDELPGASHRGGLGETVDLLPKHQCLEGRGVNTPSSTPSRISKKSHDITSYDLENISPSLLPTPPSSSPMFAQEKESLNTLITPLPTTEEATFDFSRNHDCVVVETRQTERKCEGASQERQSKTHSTLQDFYSLLDKIERTSFVGARFLEAYAEYLHDDLCRDCWFKHNIVLDEGPVIA